MIKILTRFHLIVLLQISFNSYAQDIHYSQFYASPLTLNPALTGVNDCRYRIAANYKNQWSSIPAPYRTPSVSFDINSLAPKVIKTGNLSAGLIIYNDRSGDGNLNNLSIAASGGYLIHPDVNKKHSVSIGLQVGFTQKRIDPTLLTFETQWNGSTFSSNLSNLETFSKTSFGYLNLHSGIFWAYNPSEKFKIFLGGAAFNVNQPKETFFNNSDNKLNMRTVIHGGLQYSLNDKVSLHPSFIHMSQAKSSETNLGAALSYLLNGNFNPRVSFGAYYRIGDAVIPVIAMDYKNFRVGLSYDVNTSSLNTASNYRGGLELSFNYTGCITSIIEVEPIQWCPRF
jgi:type IX secretion system PorP/SprF family membrane protein